MDEKNDYANFVEFMNQNLARIKEYFEKITILRRETSLLLLQTASLFSPEILLELNALIESGRTCDGVIMTGQQLKSEMQPEFIEVSSYSAVECEKIMQEKGMLNKEIDAECGENNSSQMKERETNDENMSHV